jgi:hypothetical protein
MYSRTVRLSFQVRHSPAQSSACPVLSKFRCACVARLGWEVLQLGNRNRLSGVLSFQNHVHVQRNVPPPPRRFKTPQGVHVPAPSFQNFKWGTGFLGFCPFKIRSTSNVPRPVPSKPLGSTSPPHHSKTIPVANTSLSREYSSLLAAGCRHCHVGYHHHHHHASRRRGPCRRRHGGRNREPWRRRR